MVLLIVQARMGSSRLPGKVLAEAAGRPLLFYLLERLRRCRTVDRIVVATSTAAADDQIAALCAAEGVLCFRGSEDDVLDRYYQAARAHGEPADGLAVVRVTADCPLMDPEVVDRVVEGYLARIGTADYVTNTLERTYPDGLDVEVVSFEALERAWKEATLPTDREHVTLYIRRNSTAEGRDLFRAHNVRGDRSYAHLRWSVDYPEDLAFLRAVLEGLYPVNPRFGFRDLVDWLRAHPEVMRLNHHIAAEVHRRRWLRNSEQLAGRACQVIPALTQTFSKAPTQFARGFAPIFIQRGRGCRVEDVDGHGYIDYVMGLCAVVLGYAHPAVNAAIARQLEDGTIFSLPHPLETELAERLVWLIPCAEMVRFCKNGSDATAGAVRAARAFTGRDHVAVCGYHGSQDWYVATTSRRQGVPEVTRTLVHPFPYNDLPALDELLCGHPGGFAAVILEPVGVTPPPEGFLPDLIELAHRHGALVIFDEIITGFRLRLGGAQEYFGVTPDLACFGKGLANGMPLAAVVGRRDVMQLFEEIFFSYTFGGETLSLAAALATIEVMEREDVIGHLWRQGARLQEECKRIIEAHGIADRVRCLGYPPRHVFRFFDEGGRESLALKTLFLQETVRRGILTNSAHNISFAHGDAEVSRTLDAYRDVFQVLAQAIHEENVEEYLQAEPVEPVFRPV